MVERREFRIGPSKEVNPAAANKKGGAVMLQVLLAAFAAYVLWVVVVPLVGGLIVGTGALVVSGFAGLARGTSHLFTHHSSRNRGLKARKVAWKTRHV